MAYRTVTVDRVLVDPNHAVTPLEAARRGIFSDVLFIRDDGWVLGAPRRLATNAYRMWQRRWMYRVDIPVMPDLSDKKLEAIARSIVDDEERRAARKYEVTYSERFGY
jgi:hypothetical protein